MSSAHMEELAAGTGSSAFSCWLLLRKVVYWRKTVAPLLLAFVGVFCGMPLPTANSLSPSADPHLFEAFPWPCCTIPCPTGRMRIQFQDDSSLLAAPKNQGWIRTWDKYRNQPWNSFTGSGHFLKPTVTAMRCEMKRAIWGHTSCQVCHTECTKTERRESEWRSENRKISIYIENKMQGDATSVNKLPNITTIMISNDIVYMSKAIFIKKKQSADSSRDKSHIDVQRLEICLHLRPLPIWVAKRTNQTFWTCFCPTNMCLTFHGLMLSFQQSIPSVTSPRPWAQWASAPVAFG